MNDLISREALQNALEGQFSAMYGKEPKHWPRSAHSALDMVADAPAVDAEPVRHGRWEWRGGIPRYSSCWEMLNGYSYETDISITPWCSFCGARMDAEVYDVDK